MLLEKCLTIKRKLGTHYDRVLALDGSYNMHSSNLITKSHNHLQRNNSNETCLPAPHPKIEFKIIINPQMQRKNQVKPTLEDLYTMLVQAHNRQMVHQAQIAKNAVNLEIILANSNFASSIDPKEKTEAIKQKNREIEKVVQKLNYGDKLVMAADTDDEDAKEAFKIEEIVKGHMDAEMTMQKNRHEDRGSGPDEPQDGGAGIV